MNKPQNLKTSVGNSPQIAIIGCGAITESYYMPAFSSYPNVLKKLILVDQNIERAKKLASTFHGIQCFNDYEDILDKVDGVIIALPTHLHHPVAMKFLVQGVPVLCEKPLAESAEKARQMVELAEKMGVSLATNYSQRLWSQFAKVKELILGQTLGEPVSIKYYVGEVFNWPTVSGFYFDSERGVLLDRGAHVMDHICWWLGGRPKVISSRNDSFGGGEAVAQVQFSYNKCVGEVKLSWLSSFHCIFVVEFENGSIEGEIYYPQSVLVKKGTGPQKRIKLKSESYEALGDKIITNFIGVLTDKEKPLVPASEVLDSIYFTDECYAVAKRFEMPWYEIPEVNNDK